jgi:hypothetical protein
MFLVLLSPSMYMLYPPLWNTLITILYLGLSVYPWLCSSFVGPWSLFRFLNLYTVGRTPWTGYQPVARPLPTHRIKAHTDIHASSGVCFPFLHSIITGPGSRPVSHPTAARDSFPGSTVGRAPSSVEVKISWIYTSITASHSGMNCFCSFIRWDRGSVCN